MSEEVLTATHDALYWQRRCIAAEQREAITADAYNQQQSSYRELETLYQASQERALRVEEAAAALRSTLQAFFQATTYDERGAIRVQLRQMVRAK
jgi:hypothetical protein